MMPTLRAIAFAASLALMQGLAQAAPLKIGLL